MLNKAFVSFSNLILWKLCWFGVTTMIIGTFAERNLCRYIFFWLIKEALTLIQIIGGLPFCLRL